MAADVRIQQYPTKLALGNNDYFLIADASDVDVNGWLKYKKVLAEDLPTIVTTAEDITIAQIQSRRAASDLTIGKFYRITNSASGVSPLFVQAVGVNAVSYQAFDAANPLTTINYNVLTDTIRWSLNETNAPINLNSLSALTPLSYNNTTGQFSIDLTDYVPYIGATSDLDLGTNDIYAGRYWMLDVPNDNYGNILLNDGVLTFQNINGNSLLTVEEGVFQFIKNASIAATFDNYSLTQSRTFTLPNASGTLALTSDLSGYISGTLSDNYVPVATGTNTITNSHIQDNGSIIKINDNVTDNGLLIDIANDIVYLTNTDSNNGFIATTNYVKTINDGNDKGLYLGFNQNIYKLGEWANDINGTHLAVDDANKIIKTTNQGNDRGLYLDYDNDKFIFGVDGNGLEVHPNSLLIKTKFEGDDVGINLDANNGIFWFGKNGGNCISISNNAEIIKTIFDNSDKGLLIDFANRTYYLGDYNYNGNGTALKINDSASILNLNVSGGNGGISLDGSNNSYKFGKGDGDLETTNVAYGLTVEGGNIQLGDGWGANNQQVLKIDSANSITKTQYNNNDRGLYLDFANGDYYFGNQEQGLYVDISTNTYQLGDFGGSTNITFLEINDNSQIIRTRNNNTDSGLYLDFDNNYYEFKNINQVGVLIDNNNLLYLGDYNEGISGTYIKIDVNNQAIRTYNNTFSDAGFLVDNNNLHYHFQNSQYVGLQSYQGNILKLGDYTGNVYGYNYLQIDTDNLIFVTKIGGQDKGLYLNQGTNFYGLGFTETGDFIGEGIVGFGQKAYVFTMGHAWEGANLYIDSTYPNQIIKTRTDGQTDRGLYIDFTAYNGNNTYNVNKINGSYLNFPNAVNNFYNTDYVELFLNHNLYSNDGKSSFKFGQYTQAIPSSDGGGLLRIELDKGNWGQANNSILNWNNEEGFSLTNYNGIELTSFSGINQSSLKIRGYESSLYAQGDGYYFDLNLDTANQVIKTRSNGVDRGLKLDLYNNTYYLGDFDNIGNYGTHIVVNDDISLIKTKHNGLDKGLFIDFTSDFYGLGFAEGGEPFTSGTYGLKITYNNILLGDEWGYYSKMNINLDFTNSIISSNYGNSDKGLYIDFNAYEQGQTTSNVALNGSYQQFPNTQALFNNNDYTSIFLNHNLYSSDGLSSLKFGQWVNTTLEGGGYLRIELDKGDWGQANNSILNWNNEEGFYMDNYNSIQLTSFSDINQSSLKIRGYESSLYAQGDGYYFDLYLDTPNQVIKTRSNGGANGLYINFADNFYFLGRNEDSQPQDVPNTNAGLVLDALNGYYMLGDKWYNSWTNFNINAVAQTIYTQSGGNNRGLYIDFATDNVQLSNSVPIGVDFNDIISKFGNLITNFGLYQEGPYTKLGDYSGNQYGYTYLTIDADSPFIKTSSGGSDKGLYLDFASNNYYLGDFNNITNGTFIGVVDDDKRINLETNRVHYRNLTTTQINALTGNQAGDVVYNTTLHVLCFYDGTGWKRCLHLAM